MTQPFTFETTQVPSGTTEAVRNALSGGRGALVVGGPGTGKSHAVAAAVNGAIWSVVQAHSFAVPRLIADISAQARAGDRPLRTYVDSGCEAA